MNRFTLSRRPQTRKRRTAVRLELERLESRNLLSTQPSFSGVLDLILAGQITPGDFKNPPSPIGTNPYSTDYNVNIDTPGSDGPVGSAPHDETTIAVNPTNPLNMIAGANDFQNVRSGNSVFVTAYPRAHVTFDGGHTWTEYPVPFRGYNWVQDPAVSFDADGTAYLATIAFQNSENLTFNSNNPDILVAHSTDGGMTWSTPVRVAAGNGAWVAQTTKGTAPDKCYLTAWGHGNAMVTWTQFHFGPAGDYIDAPIFASVTHDGGTTWTDPVPISGSYVDDMASVPTVAADGSIYVAFVHYQIDPASRSDFRVVKVDPATGQPLGAPVEVSLVYDGPGDVPINVFGEPTLQDSQFRTWAQGNITADPTDANHLAVVWCDMRNNPYPGATLPSLDPYQVQTNSDIIISQSFDGGQTWSSATVIEAPGDQFQPWGAYNSSGLLQIGYFDRSYDPANHQYGYTLASENNAGSLTFTFQQVTTVLSDPTRDCGFPGISVTANLNFPNANTFIGDYSGIAVVPGTNQVAAVWTDLRERAISGGWAEDAFFALVDTSAAHSGGTAPALISAATAGAEPRALLSSAASWQALAVDAYFMDLARTNQETSSVTEGELAKVQPAFASVAGLTRAMVTPRAHLLAALPDDLLESLSADDLLESLFAGDRLFPADLAAI